MHMSDSTPAARAVEPAASEASLGTLVKQLTEESSRLIRDELRLAQAEMTEKAKHVGVGIGAFGAAGVLALYGVGVLIACAILALALVLPAWLAALIVGVVVLAVAGVAALLGKRQVSEAGPATPERTVRSVKTDVQEIKESAQR